MDALDTAIDAALPAAVEAATASSADKAETTPAAPPKPSASSNPAATSGSEAAPKSTGSPIDAATTRPNGDGGKTSPVDSDELTDEELAKPIPPARVKAALENAREKERTRTEARVYGEEIGYSRDEFKILKPHIDALDKDAVGYWKWLGEHLRARGMMQPDQPAAPQAEAKVSVARPQPDLRAEDGTLAYYSAPAMEKLMEWQAHDLMSKFDERIKPFNETRHELEQQKVSSRADQFARAAIEDAKTWDGFEDLRPRIVAMMKADGRVTLQSAYLKLHPEWSKDNTRKLQSEARQKTLDEIAAKPKAPTKQVAPSAAPVGHNPNGRRRDSLDDRMDRALAQFQ